VESERKKRKGILINFVRGVVTFPQHVLFIADEKHRARNQPQKIHAAGNTRTHSKSFIKPQKGALRGKNRTPHNTSRTHTHLYTPPPASQNSRRRARGQPRESRTDLLALAVRFEIVLRNSRERWQKLLSDVVVLVKRVVGVVGGGGGAVGVLKAGRLLTACGPAAAAGGVVVLGQAATKQQPQTTARAARTLAADAVRDWFFMGAAAGG